MTQHSETSSSISWPVTWPFCLTSLDQKSSVLQFLTHFYSHLAPGEAHSLKKKKIQLLSCMYLLISVYVITQVSFANFYSFVQFSSSIHKLLNNFCVTAKRTYIGILYAFWTTSVWKCIHQLWKPWWRLLSLPNRFVKQCVVLSQCIDMSHCYVKLPLYTVWNVSGLSDAIL